MLGYNASLGAVFSYEHLYGQLSFNASTAVSPLKVTLVFVLETMGSTIFIVNILNDIYLFGWNKRHLFLISTMAKIVTVSFKKYPTLVPFYL